MAAFTNYCPAGLLAARRVQGLTNHCGTGEVIAPGGTGRDCLRAMEAVL